MKLSHQVILGGYIRRITSSQFEGGTLTTVLATTDLDLRGSEVATPPVVLNVRTVFAEIDITVPDDWQINTKITAPLAEFKDLRRTRPTPNEAQNESDLTLTGFTTLAEVTLRN
nr:LiaF domain-containing protein [Halococcus sediminicola]